MAWDVSFDLLRFDEAVDWFQERLPLTEEQFRQFGEQARYHGFWVAGLNKLTTISEVFRSLGKALERGSTFEAWRDSILGVVDGKLKGALSPEAQEARIELILRNWSMRAYNRARWQSQTSPAVRRVRPFGLFDAVRPTPFPSEVCTAWDGKVLPIEDFEELGLQPPLHHGCQSGIRSLTEDQARDLGGPVPPKKRPTERADSGWGSYEQPFDPAPKKKPKPKAPKKEPPKPKPAPPEPKPQALGPRIPDALKDRGEMSPGMGRLARALEVDAAAAERGDTDAQRRIRRHVRAYVHGMSGVTSFDEGARRGGSLVVDPVYPEDGGHHSWDGEISISRNLFKNLRVDWKSVGGIPKRLRALQVLIHEELHGCSPGLDPVYTTGRSPDGKKILFGGGLIEEATTEALARRLLKAGHGYATEFWGSYQPGINFLESLIRRVTGMTETQAHEALLLASARMRAGSSRTETELEHIEAFLDGIDGLTSQQRREMRDELAHASVEV